MVTVDGSDWNYSDLRKQAALIEDRGLIARSRRKIQGDGTAGGPGSQS